MSRSRMIAVGLAAGALLAMSLAGCAKAVTGTPVAASAPTTHSSPTQSGGSSGGSGGSGGSGSTAADRFCATITPDMVQQAFGVPGAQVTTGKSQDANGVAIVNCLISGGSAGFEINVVAFDYSGQQNVTSQSALQNAQTQVGKAGGTNFQPQTGVGDADAAFSYQQAVDGVTSYAVFAAKQNQGDVSASDVVAAGITPAGPVQLAQVIKFASLVDSG